MAKYKVIGPHEIAGHAPGSVFEAEFDEEKEAYHLEAGHIEKARADAKVRENEEEGEE